MTRQERDALRELMARATPGPWTSTAPDGPPYYGGWEIAAEGETKRYPEGTRTPVPATAYGAADSALIVALRNNATVLLDDADRCAKLETANDGYCRAHKGRKSPPRYLDEVRDLRAQLAAKEEALVRAAYELESVIALTECSQGVAGYHLNGELAEWGTVGLGDWRDALATIRRAINPSPAAGEPNK
jgi:hypothetical protein